VHAEDAAGVTAGGPRLAAEAGREGAIAQRQLVGFEDLVGVQSRQRDLRGAGEEKVVLLDLVDLSRASGK